MKTPLNLDDALLIEANVLAARQRTSLTKLVEEALRLRVHGLNAPTVAPPLSLPIFHGRGRVLPGIDPKSNTALLAALNPQ